MRLRNAGAFFFRDKIGIWRSVLKSGIDFGEENSQQCFFHLARELKFLQRKSEALRIKVSNF